MTDEEIKHFLQPKHDWMKLVQFIIGVTLFCVTIAGIFIAIGKNEAAVSKIQRIEDKQIQQQDDITSIRYEAKGANSGVQRVEQKVDDGMKDINTQLRQIRFGRTR